MNGEAIELSPPPSVVAALRVFATATDVLLFDSAVVGEKLGRYSFLMADPITQFEQVQPVFGGDPFAGLRTMLDRVVSEPIAELPPFQGGIAGCLTYELGQCFEQFPSAAIDDQQLPVLHAGLYPWVIAWDHHVDPA